MAACPPCQCTHSWIPLLHILIVIVVTVVLVAVQRSSSGYRDPRLSKPTKSRQPSELCGGIIAYMLGILVPCIHEGGCILEHDHLRSATTSASTSTADTSSSLHDQYSTLYHTGSAARWRRKQGDYFSHNGLVTTTRLSAARQRSMEEVHGVDVSWLHHPGKSGMSYRQCDRGRVTSGGGEWVWSAGH